MPSESGVVARCKNISCPNVAGFTRSMRGVNPRASGQIRSGRAAKNIAHAPGSPQAATKQRVHASQCCAVRLAKPHARTADLKVTVTTGWDRQSRTKSCVSLERWLVTVVTVPRGFDLLT